MSGLIALCLAVFVIAHAVGVPVSQGIAEGTSSNYRQDDRLTAIAIRAWYRGLWTGKP